MKMRSILSLVAALSLAVPVLVGCDDTIESERSVDVKKDGTVVEKEKKTVEKPDGSIQTTEKKEVDKPN